MAKKLSEAEKARRAWVRALRSGKYGWGKEELHPEVGKYCCLGVLCEVALKRGIIDYYDPALEVLPDEVRIWAGLADEAGEYNNSRYSASSLAEINDESLRNPFHKIANFIEEKPDGLFLEGS